LGSTRHGKRDWKGGDRPKGPYGDLYVYLINGLVAAKNEAGLGETFLGNWVEEENSFLFFSTPAEEKVGQLLGTQPGLELIEDYHFSYEEWQGGSLKPFKIADFVIVPPWERLKDNKEGIHIVLDPGVVFGNGLHPTTRDCLKALSFTARQKSFKRVLDLGTGTGVLGLAAALLGAERVLAVDLNPLCLRTAIENVRLNNLCEAIEVIEGRADDSFNEVADLVIANIHFEVIRNLLERRVPRKTDRFIISGLMRSQAQEIKSQLAKRSFHVIREWDHEMTWYTILAAKS